jgi:predicted nucleic acid-binding protein
MTAVFADTFYFIALLSPGDESHSKAVEFTRRFTGRLVTTAWVLTELADGLVESHARERFVDFYDRLRVRDDVVIIPCTPELFDEGIELFRQRPDKKWSLTDCISFVVMQRENVTGSLTADHHFEQAGFSALLK